MYMYIYCKPIPMEASLYFNMSMAYSELPGGEKPRIPVVAKRFCHSYRVGHPGL